MRRHVGFTLIEVLVVVAIIALLVGILVPSLTRARTQTRVTVCTSNLHQIGLAMIAYLQDSRDRMPAVSLMPSASSYPLDLNKPAVYLADVLRKHMLTGKNRLVENSLTPPVGGKVYPDVGTGGAFECPDDKPGNNERPIPPGPQVTYYQSEKSSYEYRTQLNGVTPMEFSQHTVRTFRHRGGGSATPKKLASNSIWFARDWWNFHYKVTKKNEDGTEEYVPSTFPSRRYVYIDGHVGDYEN